METLFYVNYQVESSRFLCKNKGSKFVIYTSKSTSLDSHLFDQPVTDFFFTQ